MSGCTRCGEEEMEYFAMEFAQKCQQEKFEMKSQNPIIKRFSKLCYMKNSLQLSSAQKNWGTFRLKQNCRNSKEIMENLKLKEMVNICRTVISNWIFGAREYMRVCPVLPFLYTLLLFTEHKKVSMRQLFCFGLSHSQNTIASSSSSLFFACRPPNHISWFYYGAILQALKAKS